MKVSRTWSSLGALLLVGCSQSLDDGGVSSEAELSTSVTIDGTFGGGSGRVGLPSNVNTLAEDPTHGIFVIAEPVATPWAFPLNFDAHFSILRYTRDGAQDQLFEVPYMYDPANAASSGIQPLTLAALGTSKLLIVGLHGTRREQLELRVIDRTDRARAADPASQHVIILDGAGWAPDGEKRAPLVQAAPDGSAYVAFATNRHDPKTIRQRLVHVRVDGSVDLDLDWITSTRDFTEVAGLELQPDGKILFATRTTVRGATIERRLPNGSVDTSFGVGGRVEVSGMSVRGIKLAPDGSIYGYGWATMGLDRGGALTRVASTGVVDTSFGDGGVAKVDLTRYDERGSFAFGTRGGTTGFDGAFVSGGKIYGLGRAPRTYGRSLEEATVLARFDAKGALDRSFGGDAHNPGYTEILVCGPLSNRTFDIRQPSPDRLLVGSSCSHSGAQGRHWTMAKFRL